MKGMKRIVLVFSVFFMIGGIQAQTAFHAAIVIKANQHRSIHLASMQKGDLDRQIYFRGYHYPGIVAGYDNIDWQDMNITPGRGTGPAGMYLTKPDEPFLMNLSKTGDLSNLIDSTELHRMNQKWVESFKYGYKRFGDIDWAMAGHRFYPLWMRQGDNDWHKPVRREMNPLAAELVLAWFEDLKQSGAPYPDWFTLRNEPPTNWSSSDLGDLTRLTALKMQDQFPDVKICGPCRAWFWGGEDFKTWENLFKDYIDAAGDVIDAYDLHTYSKGYWAYTKYNYWGKPNDMSKKQKHPSLFDSQKTGNGHVWDYGRLEGLLDYLAAYQVQRWGNSPKPVIVTEFGRQSLEPQLGPWENDFKPWLYMNTVIRMCLTFMDRPEVELAIPFIVCVPEKDYGPKRGQAIFNRPGAPEDLTIVRTRFYEFYKFFKDLKGTRIAYDFVDTSYPTSHYLRTQCFLDGDVLYILMHNGRSYPHNPVTVDLLCRLNDSEIINKQIKRLRWHGPVPQDHKTTIPRGTLRIDMDYNDLNSLSHIQMAGEETCIVRLQLSSEPGIKSYVREKTYLYPETLVDIQSGKPYEFVIDLPETKNLNQAELALGFARNNGFDANPVLNINGKSVIHTDLSYSQGIKNFHNVIKTRIPVEYLKKGPNRVSINFPAGSCDGIVKLVTAKIITSTLEKRED